MVSKYTSTTLSSKPPNSTSPSPTRPSPPHPAVRRPSAAPRACCARVLSFVFSHVGLCGLVVAYSVAGAFIFRHLEQTNEKQVCIKSRDKYIASENETVTHLWQISRAYFTSRDRAEHEFTGVLRQFQQNVLDLQYDGTQCGLLGTEAGEAYEWSFPGALLFSVTVITTIGYGNIAPKTFWGRLVCIAYAVLGVPLMLLCLANIGDVLADVFRFVYINVCCCGCCRRRNRLNVGSQNLASQRSHEEWKRHYVKHHPDGAQVLDDEDYVEEDYVNLSVPLTVTMTIITVYIFSGAVIFSMWEGWDWLTSSYFCFVTISTIGFGDLVPGATTFTRTGDEYKMVFTAVYMLFGMAILSMCFSLIQDEIVAKFRWLGQKLGIIEVGEDAEARDPPGTGTHAHKKSQLRGRSGTQSAKRGTVRQNNDVLQRKGLPRQSPNGLWSTYENSSYVSDGFDSFGYEGKYPLKYPPKFEKGHSDSINDHNMKKRYWQNKDQESRDSKGYAHMQKAEKLTRSTQIKDKAPMSIPTVENTTTNKKPASKIM